MREEEGRSSQELSTNEMNDVSKCNQFSFTANTLNINTARIKKYIPTHAY
jgi:hypothetical protein